MFSFHVPIAALAKQQQRLELIGENIANINTTGYKTSRMTFVETLGTVTGVTETSFGQGNISYTGHATDLAITGNSFFVIKAGDEQVYTRNGAFKIDVDGKLVTSSGYAVQGWMENIGSAGSGSGTSSLGDIVIDSNLVLAADATENIWLSGNLNAGLKSIAEVWNTGSEFTQKAHLTTSGVTYPLNVVAGVNDEFQITLNPKYDESTIQTITLSPGVYADADALVTEINSQITGTDLDGRVEAVNYNGSLKIRSTDGLSGTILTLNSGSNDVLSELGFNDGDNSTSGINATAATEFNDLLQVTTDLEDDDSFSINGKLQNGDEVDGSFIYGSANDGTTLGDLLNVLNTEYAGSSTAEIVDGIITLTDVEEGDSSTTISFTADSDNVGQLTVPSFVNETAGYTGRATTSIIVYDSLGKSHNLTVDFVKTKDEGTWVWTVTGADNEEIIRGGSGRAVFDNSGNFLSFIYDGGVDAVTIDPQNGAEEMIIRIRGEASGGFTGLSQYNSVSTLYGREQDGRASESLNGFSIQSDGSIIGSFGTGEEIKLAQIALATFKDPTGLQKIGDSSYVATDESGIAQIGTAESQNSTIEPSSLELSTVDLADQFTKMIEAQRAYQAASRVITTFEEVFDETSRLKR
ncbi:MAG: flagellar hook-basal body complex protein [Candidatus Marinimicrobia bacterium]|nr:flagellar hook-basal body complex protein [Candidatus Neomarinimicrobiota bacterium]